MAQKRATGKKTRWTRKFVNLGHLGCLASPEDAERAVQVLLEGSALVARAADRASFLEEGVDLLVDATRAVRVLVYDFRASRAHPVILAGRTRGRRPAGKATSVNRPMIDYVLDTGFVAHTIQDDGTPVACAPLFLPDSPRTFGVIALERTWEDLEFSNGDLEVAALLARLLSLGLARFADEALRPGPRTVARAASSAPAGARAARRYDPRRIDEAPEEALDAETEAVRRPQPQRAPARPARKIARRTWFQAPQAAPSSPAHPAPERAEAPEAGSQETATRCRIRVEEERTAPGANRRVPVAEQSESTVTRCRVRVEEGSESTVTRCKVQAEDSGEPTVTRCKVQVPDPAPAPALERPATRKRRTVRFKEVPLSLNVLFEPGSSTSLQDMLSD